VCSCCIENINGKFVEISVSDNGLGIDALVAKRIFEPFYTTKKVGEGTGLGLSVITGVVHNAGGHILLESEVGVGTTFRLLFPYQ
jgi:signal transduction histidine kinase